MARWLVLLTLVGAVTVSGTSCQMRISNNGEDTGTPAKPPEPARTAPAPTESEVSAPVAGVGKETDEGLTEEGFATNAFPPTMPDTDWHRTAWVKNDCLRCHETGVQTAPKIVHAGLPSLLLGAKCRTCHVLIPGSKPRGAKAKQLADSEFAEFAFPPMIPNSGSHRDTWVKDDCLLCHEDGLRGAPIVKHENMPRILVTAKCRSCHVQVRALDEPPTD